jgi:6-pyruvoyltetrahydropterin/6-carboxytetrahydropterin synthase
MLSITKTFEFCASHKLYNPNWSDQRNFEVFGKCANPNGHGHNYRLEVSISGPIDKDHGMIINASELSDIVKEYIFNELDHKNLDADVEWLKGRITSVEILTEAIWERLEEALKVSHSHLKLSQIKLWETSKIYALKTAD